MRVRLRITLRLRLRLRHRLRRREGVWVCTASELTVVELREGRDAVLYPCVLIDEAAEEEEVPKRLRRRPIERERAGNRLARR